MDHRPPKRKAAEVALEGIRSLIRERKLCKGDSLPTELELAAMIGTSRNTVREAISMLKAYGIIETRQKVGAILTDNRHEAAMNIYSFALDISPETFSDIQGFRLMIEEGVSHDLFERVTASDLRRLRRMNAELTDCDGEAEAARLDFDFHVALVDLAGNRTASDVYRIIRPSILKIMQLGKTIRSNRDEIASEHNDIVGAIESRDAAAYAVLVRHHLRQGLRYV